MKQYIKSKSIRWFFKFWFRCLNKLRHLYQMSIYSYKKQTTEFNLSQERRLEGTFCTVIFNNPFRELIFVEKLFGKNIYTIGTACVNRKQMPKMTED